MAKPVILRFVADTKRLTKAFLKSAGEAETYGRKMQKVGLGVAAAVGGMVAGAGLGLAKLGGDFHTAYAAIRVTTGKTGKELEGLQASFRNVLSQTPAGMGDVSSAIGTISQQLGLSGKPLEEFSLQMIRLGRITKTDVKDNVKTVTSVLNNWAIPAKNAASTTDLLFRASQQSGVSVASLGEQLTQSGAQFRALGFDITDTTSIIGLLGKSGMSASDIMPSLGRVMAKSAKEGKDAGDTFRKVFSAIALAPDATTAATIAYDTFGSRAGPKFAALIREGKLSFDDFAKSIKDGKGTIAKTASETSTWQGKLGVLKNQVKVTLEPLATKVFGALTDAVAKLMPYLREFGDWFSKNKDTLKPYAIALGAVAAALTVVAVATAAWNAVLAVSPITWIIVGIGLLVAGLILAYQKVGWFRTAVDAVARFFRDKVGPAFKHIAEIVWHAMQAMWDHAKPIWNAIVQIVTAAVHFVQGIIQTVMAAIRGDWSGVWEGIKKTLSAAWDYITGVVRLGIEQVKTLWDGLASIGGGVWDWLGDGLTSVWNWILRTIGSGVNTAIDILNDLIDAANYIPGVNIDHIAHVTWGQVGGAQPTTTTAARGGGVRAMATGGIVTRPTLALVGEAGPEAVIPLGRMGRNANHYTINISTLDARTAATAVVDALKVYERQRGPIPIRTRTA